MLPYESLVPCSAPGLVPLRARHDVLPRQYRAARGCCVISRRATARARLRPLPARCGRSPPTSSRCSRLRDAERARTSASSSRQPSGARCTRWARRFGGGGGALRTMASSLSGRGTDLRARRRAHRRAPTPRRQADRGVPDEHGFLAVDDHWPCAGVPGVYPPATAQIFAVKLGGLAAEMADAAASTSRPSRRGRRIAAITPILRGKLLTAGRAASAAPKGSWTSPTSLWCAGEGRARHLARSA